MTAVLASQIEIDANGEARIAGTRSKVRQIVIDTRVHGMSPQRIHDEYPHLSLAQIHCALAYYYEHQEALDDEIDRATREARAAAREISNPALQAKLARLLH